MLNNAPCCHLQLGQCGLHGEKFALEFLALRLEPLVDLCDSIVLRIDLSLKPFVSKGDGTPSSGP